MQDGSAHTDSFCNIVYAEIFIRYVFLYQLFDVFEKFLVVRVVCYSLDICGALFELFPFIFLRLQYVFYL